MSTVVLLSGGLDSTTLLYRLVTKDREEVHPLVVDYGQRHGREVTATHRICREVGLEPHLLDMSYQRSLLFGKGSVSGDEDIPEGHYTAQNMESPVAPNRNMVLLSLAAAYAVSHECDWVAYAAHGGDHHIYPDCRPVFVDAVARAIRLGTGGVKLYTPYLNWTKADIVREGLEMDVPYKYTWSCYKGQELACGKCGTCVERLEAFELAGAKDPLRYQKDWKEPR